MNRIQYLDKDIFSTCNFMPKRAILRGVVIKFIHEASEMILDQKSCHPVFESTDRLNGISDNRDKMSAPDGSRLTEVHCI